MKKLLSILLVLAMVLALAPLALAAEDAAEAPALDGMAGDNLSWKLTGDGELTISGSGDMENYHSEDRPWHSYTDAIVSVVIESGVTSIGDYVFYDCKSLRSVTIPEGVKTIGRGAFCWCDLQIVTIPDSVDSIGDDAFAYNYDLTVVTLGRGLETIGEAAFSGCGLRSLTIPDSVVFIGDYAFYNNADLSSVTIGSNVQTIGDGAFLNDPNLKSVTIPYHITAIGSQAFGYTYDPGSETYIPTDGFTITGYPDSAAEDYAKENDLLFVSAAAQALAVTFSADVASAKVTGAWSGLYARVALVLDNGGVSGLYVTQAMINTDGTVLVPSFMVPGLTVKGVNVSLVPTLADIQSTTPNVKATASKML